MKDCKKKQTNKQKSSYKHDRLDNLTLQNDPTVISQCKQRLTIQSKINRQLLYQIHNRIDSKVKVQLNR